MEDYVRRSAHRGGLRLRRHPAHHQGAALFETSGHLPYYEDTMFPADGAGEREVLPQGHELPDAQPDLPVARAVLPRAAAAVLRVRLGLPVREVRRRARPHPRARPDPGRLAQLRHPGAGARRDPPPAGLRARPAARLRPRRLLPGAVHPRRRPGEAAKFIGSDEEWAVATEGARGGGPGDRPGAGPRPGRRGVLRPEDLRPGARRHRPHLADVDHPVRLQPARPLRPGVHLRRRRPRSSR